MKRLPRFARGVIAAVALSVLGQGAVWGETTTVRIGHQFGLGYLPLYVMEGQKLVEKYAQKEGLTSITVQYSTIGSTSALADQILSGNIDFASAGPPPFLVLWDHTLGSVRAVRMVCALNEQPMKLNTNDPNVHSLKDLSLARDRIAVPSIKTSMHSILLGMAAEQLWGPGNYARLEPMQVPLKHPDAVAALLSGKSDITTHFATIPFSYTELADPHVHTILTASQITGGPTTITGIWGTEEFRKKNPKAFHAVFKAIEEAVNFINKDHAGAAKLYIALTHSSMTQEQIEKMLADPEVKFGVTPHKTMIYANYMHHVGMLKHQPKSWKDLFFSDVYGLPGS